MIAVSPEESRPLPSPPGGRGGTLAPLNMQAEKKKIKKKKKRLPPQDGAQSIAGTEVSGDLYDQDGGHMTE